MKLALSLASIAGLALVAIAEPPKDAPKTAPTKTTTTAAAPADPKAPSFDEMMKMWADMNKPGPEHKELAKLIGDWDMTIKSFNPMNPGEVHESKGTEKCEWLIEGRYLKCHTLSQMGSESFIGFGINGFNAQTKKFETTWVDSMSTAQMAYVGTLDANHNLSMECQYDDPMSGTKKTSKMVCTWTDANTRGFKMYEVEGGKDVLMMEATYTRKSATTGQAKPVGEKTHTTTDTKKPATK